MHISKNLVIGFLVALVILGFGIKGVSILVTETTGTTSVTQHIPTPEPGDIQGIPPGTPPPQ
jgi:hypothetical protein